MYFLSTVCGVVKGKESRLLQLFALKCDSLFTAGADTWRSAGRLGVDARGPAIRSPVECALHVYTVHSSATGKRGIACLVLQSICYVEDALCVRIRRLDGVEGIRRVGVIDLARIGGLMSVGGDRIAHVTITRHENGEHENNAAVPHGHDSFAS